MVHRRLAFWPVALVVALGAGCAPRQPVINTYSVLDVDKPDTPALTVLQLRWLDLIHRAPAYRADWSHLRFAFVGEQQRSVVPLIVFNPDDAHGVRGVMVRVVGGQCNAYYDPIAELPFTGTEATCGPGWKRTYKEVPGERDLIGYDPLEN